jgi:O-antigen biosynthesis alpha-1,3-mannosyltransferase
MMKVTHIFKTYFPETSGGLEEAIRQCGSHAVENGFEVEVVSVGPRSCDIVFSDGIRARFFKKTTDFLSTPFSLSLARSFTSICKETDILHFHFPWPSAELMALFFQVKTPMVVTFHCDIHKIPILKRLYLPLLTRYLKKVDKICVTSDALLASTPYLGPFQDKIETIPLFLNENRFLHLSAPRAQTLSFTRKIGDYALFVGVLRWYKGLHVLLDAAQRIDKDVVIVGKGDLYRKLAAEIRARRLHNVHLLGFKEDADLKWLIENARMIVLPSIAPAEAFGQILLEGLYFSRPLISTELGTGTSIVNRHGYTGIVIRPGCAASLARAMDKIFFDDRLAAEFSANAGRHYLARFTRAAQGDKYLRIYRSLCHDYSLHRGAMSDI